jgi:ADP-ribose pyrophosphatase
LKKGKSWRGQELQSWRTLDRKECFAAPPWIAVSVETVRLPDGRLIRDYHRIRLPEYAGVVAVTAEGRIILQRQYRHGVGRVSLLLPGGMVEKGEPPLRAARRELREETGYRAARWRRLGSFVPNSNYGCGRAHLFLAEGARWVSAPDSGDLEETEIVLLRPAQVRSRLRRGDVESLGTAAALALAFGHTNARLA